MPTKSGSKRKVPKYPNAKLVSDWVKKLGGPAEVSRKLKELAAKENEPTTGVSRAAVHQWTRRGTNSVKRLHALSTLIAQIKNPLAVPDIDGNNEDQK